MFDRFRGLHFIQFGFISLNSTLDGRPWLPISVHPLDTFNPSAGPVQSISPHFIPTPLRFRLLTMTWHPRTKPGLALRRLLRSSWPVLLLTLCSCRFGAPPVGCMVVMVRMLRLPELCASYPLNGPCMSASNRQAGPMVTAKWSCGQCLCPSAAAAAETPKLIDCSEHEPRGSLYPEGLLSARRCSTFDRSTNS